MPINKKLIHFNTKQNFLGANGINNQTTEDSNGNYGNIPKTSIVFIKDTKEIWTHGQFYGNTMDDKYIAYIQDAFNEKVGSLFTITLKTNGRTGASIAADSTSTITQKIIMETKFNGNKKNCDATPIGWTKEATGEYSLSKDYSIATFSTDKTIEASASEFSYTIQSNDTPYYNKYGAITINKNPASNYTASIVYPIYYGWCNYANPSAVPSGTNVSTVIRGLGNRVERAHDGTFSTTYKTAASGVQYFWLVVRGTGSITQSNNSSVASTSSVSLTGNNSVSLGTYNVYCTASFNGTSGDFVVSATCNIN